MSNRPRAGAGAGSSSKKTKAVDAPEEPPPPGKRVRKAAPEDVHTARVRRMNAAAFGDKTGPVVYWMSRDQRVADNWALLFARQVADAKGVPVVVCFNLLPEFLGATIRQYGFMLRGLKEVEASLEAHGIPFVLLEGNALPNVLAFAQAAEATAVVCDFSPLRFAVKWRKDLGKALKDTPVYEVDAHNVVPVWVTSDKVEYAARTIRPKIHKQLKTFLTDFPAVEPQEVKWAPPEGYSVGGLDWGEIAAGVTVDRSVAEVTWCKPGEAAAKAQLDKFLKRINKYDKERNDPSKPGEPCSGLSPYFHFGQLSPQRAALEASKLSKSASSGVAAFIEESVVRRELSDNFCYYNNDGYDRLDGLYPAFNQRHWAQETLAEHAGDEREFVYTAEQLETSKTHDEFWNAAQDELRFRGKMHGFMRMFWAKKILEWTASPQEALRVSIYLNDKYSLDGRDPNGYVGCAWSIAGVHDNAWKERPVYGKVRYMNKAGCKRKFDIAKYVAKVRAMRTFGKGL